MAINMQKSLIAAGVGVVDEVLEYWDEQPGGSQLPFQSKKDLGRLVLAGLGYGLQAFMPAQAQLGETIALAATPLLVKSIAKPLKAALLTPRAATAMAFRARSPVSTIPIPAPAAPPGMQRIG